MKLREIFLIAPIFLLTLSCVDCPDKVNNKTYSYGIELILQDESGTEIVEDNLEIQDITGSVDFETEEYKPVVAKIVGISSRNLIIFPKNNVDRQSITSFTIHSPHYLDAIVNLNEVGKEIFVPARQETSGGCDFTFENASNSRKFIRNVLNFVFPTACAMGCYPHTKCIREFGEWDRITVTLEAVPQQSVLVQNQELWTNRTSIGQWETFAMVDINQDNRISDGDVANFIGWTGHYWTAEFGGGDTVNVNRTHASVWEEFT